MNKKLMEYQLAYYSKALRVLRAEKATIEEGGLIEEDQINAINEVITSIENLHCETFTLLIDFERFMERNK